MTTFHDVANAFPSPTHEALDGMVDATVREDDRELLKLRYGDTRMVVRGHNEVEVVVAPRCGGLQGDACMAPMFSAMYDVGVDEWVRGRDAVWDDGLCAVDPLSGTTQ